MRDRGHAAVELALAVGVLLIPAALAVLAFGPWSERRVSAEAIAAETARAAVIALDLDAAETAGVSQASEMGLEVSELRMGWCGARPSNPAAGTCTLGRGSAVTVTISVWTPLVSTPWGEVGGIWVSADHSEPIDLYRSLA